MLIVKKGYTRNYRYGGSGLFDSVIGAITSTAAKEAAKQVAIDVGKKTATQIGQRAANKAVDKIIPKKGSAIDHVSTPSIDLQALIKKLSKK